MTQLWMDGFDHYGGDVDLLLDGPWGEVLTDNIELGAPDVGARTGTFALRFKPTTGIGVARRVLGADYSEIFVGFGFFMEVLPFVNSDYAPIQFRDSGNNLLLTMTVRADGAIQFRTGGATGTILAETTGPVLQTGKWHHIEVRTVIDAAAGIFECRVDEQVVLNATGLNTGAVDIAQLALIRSAVNIDGIFYIDDLIVRNTSGSVNNGFEGDLRVATLSIIEDGANQGWAIQSIQNIGTGVMDFLDTVTPDEALAYPDLAAYEIGSGDFAIEGFVRFSNPVGVSETATIFSKWRESTDERSWRLILTGAGAGTNLIWETSVLGTNADIVQVTSGFSAAFVTDRWFHFAVTREGTDLRVFVDGIIVASVADSRTYFDGTAALFINGGQNTPTTTNDGESVDGWMDAVRFTVGSARYTANFTPPVASLVDDANTELLLNFDDISNTDESGNAVTGTLINGASVIFPDDDEAFQTLQNLDPDDNNYVEAALISAIVTLTLTGQPLDTETIVLDAKTYTFQATLTDVNGNILIGATASDSLDNLRSAINLEAGAGTKFAASMTVHPTIKASDLSGDLQLMTALTPGTAGNSLVSTETLTNGSFSDVTLLGGLDIPANSEFTVSALPFDTTGVKSAAIVTRSFKTDSGAAGLTASFVAAGGASGAGAENFLTVDPTYYEDTFEVDPATSGDMTPSTITGSRIRLNRTT